jgi:predicted nucleic acid-binding protein
VLIDTSAFYALISASDSFHQRARETYERLIDRDQELWTTSYVLVETIALAHRRLGFQVLSEFMGSVHGELGVFWVESTVHTEAWERLTASQGSGLSFVDWTTALVAGMLGADVFTFDRGFANQGLAVLPR